MNTKVIQARVDAIRRWVGDTEAVQALEHGLWMDVLRAIATGTAEDPRACAAAAMETLACSEPKWAVVRQRWD